jgi:hypothetical protein
MYWILTIKYGFNSDLYFGAGGNNIALQLVMDGLKMQPCSPTFLDARDAILAADQATYGGANQCEIWRAFARRGMGKNAMDGGDHNSAAIIEDFTVPTNCRAPLVTSISREEPFHLTWLALDGGVYRVQQSPSLVNQVWTDFPSAVTSLNISASLTLPTTSTNRLYFRVYLDE